MVKRVRKTIEPILRTGLFYVPLVGLFWLSSIWIHELGHVWAASATGGTIVYIDVRPWRFSSTIVQPNPSPSLVLWSGFLLGWLLPLVTLPGWKTERWSVGALCQSWAAFCWLAFGSYLALAMGESLSDTGQLLRLGWSKLLLCGVGFVVAFVGYAVGRRAVTRLPTPEGELRISWAMAVAACLALAAWWTMQSVSQSWLEQRFGLDVTS